MKRRRDFAIDPAVPVHRAPDLTVAQTILEQLGGRPFARATGAKDFLGGPDSLSFKIPKTPGILTQWRQQRWVRTRRIRGVRITRTAPDLYLCEFYDWGRTTERRPGPPKGARGQRLKGGWYGAIDTRATVENVPGDQLRAVFTRITGHIMPSRARRSYSRPSLRFPAGCAE